MKHTWRKFARFLVVAAALAFVAVGVWQGRGRRHRRLTIALEGVMGTEAKLIIVTAPAHRDVAEAASQAAEAELRKVEALMSTHLAGSQLGRFNAAEAGQVVPLSPQVIDVLRIASEVAKCTGGAFDITCKPLLELWRRCGKQQRLPKKQEIDEARKLVGWQQIRLHESAAEKLKNGVSVDLGGIAKGYAIDRALEAIRKAGCTGGLVDVGGDIRCFGPSGRGDKWKVGIRNPFTGGRGQLLATLAVADAAVCTSGNYFRYVEIAGRRYSHIVDPRTGEPADAAASVTVVAPTATVADAWATALSVLREDGLKLLPEDGRIEAMIVIGSPEDFRVYSTRGFGKLFIDKSEPLAQRMRGQTNEKRSGNE